MTYILLEKIFLSSLCFYDQDFLKAHYDTNLSYDLLTININLDKI